MADLIIRIQGDSADLVRDLTRSRDELNRLRRQADQTQDQLRRLQRGQDNVGNSARGMGSAFRVAAAAASALGVGFAALDTVQTIARFQETRSMLQGLTSSSQEYAEAQQFITETAQKMSIELDTGRVSYSKLLALQKAGIVTGEESQAIFIGMANAAAQLGASSAQVGQSMFGMAQGMTAGTLRAEELNQVTEPLPGLLQELDKAAQLPAGGFRKLVNEGKITSEFFKTTLIEALQAYEGAAERATDNLGRQYTRLQNEYTLLKESLEEPVSEVLSAVMERTTNSIQELRETAETFDFSRLIDVWIADVELWSESFDRLSDDVSRSLDSMEDEVTLFTDTAIGSIDLVILAFHQMPINLETAARLIVNFAITMVNDLTEQWNVLVLEWKEAMLQVLLKAAETFTKVKLWWAELKQSVTDYFDATEKVRNQVALVPEFKPRPELESAMKNMRQLNEETAAFGATTNEAASDVAKLKAELEKNQAAQAKLKETTQAQITTEAELHALRQEGIDQAEAEILKSRQVALAKREQTIKERELFRAIQEGTEFTDKSTAATAAETAGVGANTSAVGKNTGARKAASKAMSEAEKEAKKLAREQERLTERIKDFDEALALEIQSLERIAEAYKLSLEAGEDMESQIRREQEVRRAGLVIGTAEATQRLDELKQRDLLKDKIEDQTDALEEEAKKAEEAAKAAGPYAEEWERASNSINQAFADAWRGAFDSFKDFANAIKNAFLTLLAELAHAAITNKILIQLGLGTAGTAATGIAGAAGNTGLLGGLFGNSGSSILGGLTLFGAGGGSSALGGGLFGTGGGLFGLTGGSLFGTGGGIAAGGLAGAAGVAGAGGLGAGGAGAGALAGGAGLGTLGTLGIVGAGIAAIALLASLFGSNKSPHPRSTALAGGISNQTIDVFGRRLGGNDPAAIGRPGLNRQFRNPIIGASGLILGTYVEDADEDTAIGFRDALLELDKSLVGILGPVDLAEAALGTFGETSEGFVAGIEDGRERIVDSLEEVSEFFIRDWVAAAAEMEQIPARIGEIFADMEGSAEDLLVGLAALQTIEDFLDADVIQDYTDAVRVQNRTLFEAFTEQRVALDELIAGYDGSVQSSAQLAGALQERYALELALLAQIDSAIQSINATFDSSIQAIGDSQLGEEELYEVRRQRIHDLVDELKVLEDPARIAETSAEILRLTNQLFSSLAEEQQALVAEEFIAFLDGVRGIANDQLEKLQEDIRFDDSLGKQGSLAASIDEAMERAAGRIEEAGERQWEAGNKMGDASIRVLQAAQSLENAVARIPSLIRVVNQGSREVGYR